MENNVFPIKKPEPIEHDNYEWWGNGSYYGWLMGRVLILSTFSQKELARRNVERIMNCSK